MKKILILLAVICFCGCGTGITTEEPTQNINIKYYYKSPSVYLYTAEIEGHLYVIYSGSHNGGIIHAEHCPCKMK